MPRKPRSFYEGELYRIYARGNGREAIFYDDGHRQRFLRLAAATLPAAGASILAYCLMGNHFHLIVRAGWLPLGKPMQRLLSAYARNVNREAGRSGHLFERRYQAEYVHDDTYACTLLRYVHLNPVRANLVTDPAAYRWSSHAAYLAGSGPEWLHFSDLLRLFGRTPARASRRYRSFCEGSPRRSAEASFSPASARVAEADGAWPDLHAPQPTAPRAHSPCRDEGEAALRALVSAATSVCRIGEHELLYQRTHRASRARGLVARWIQETNGPQLSDFARLTGFHVSTLSNAGRRWAEQCDLDPESAAQWQCFMQDLQGLHK